MKRKKVRLLYLRSDDLYFTHRELSSILHEAGLDKVCEAHPINPGILIATLF